MNPATIKGATHSLTAPPDWSEEERGRCGLLHIRQDPQGFMQSAWEPTPEERAAIAQGAPVILTIWGGVHPPVALEAVVAPAPDAEPHGGR